MVAGAIAEEGEVGGKIERREIARAVAQHGIRQAQRIEAVHRHSRRQQMLDLGGEARDIERGDEQRRSLGLRQRRDQLRRMSRERAGAAFHILHIIARQRQPRQRQRLRRHLRHIQRIVDRHRALRRKRLEQALRFFRRERVSEGLEEGVAARCVAEGLDEERHALAKFPVGGWRYLCRGRGRSQMREGTPEPPGGHGIVRGRGGFSMPR